MLNGTAVVGDWEGEFTYVGPRGCFVIDYIIVNENSINRIDSFRIEDRTNSDHMPLILTLEGWKKDKEEAEEGKRKKDKGKEEVVRIR